MQIKRKLEEMIDGLREKLRWSFVKSKNEQQHNNIKIQTFNLKSHTTH